MFVTPTSDIAESFSTILIILIFNLLKVGHPCSVVDDPNARDNLMQAYGCKSGETNSSHKKFTSEIASSKKLEWIKNYEIF